ncbi:sensor histidine kinase [Paenibacillus thalictri]|uniref:Heme sensor protein HssS n=1 Tax=Paenibacillus thalictri TaxID=2527873 RepID=A0A4Q9DH82_9BACL|nr:HAMP domain-containing sensor histidine kinase [Paenibacillus thalictri]TBL70781.1 sensor histidine kinase [Paenibacillus thalictri]
MRQTLYLRVVATFLAAVMFGLTAAGVVGTAFFRDRLNEDMQNELVQAGLQMSRMYTELGVRDAAGYFSAINALQEYDVVLYDSQTSFRSFAAAKADKEAGISGITSDMIDKVLAGSVYRSSGSKIDRVLVGIPLQSSGGMLALFMQPSQHRWNSGLQPLMYTTLITALAAGSLFIFIAARYLVKPLRAMTAATRRMARGDFEVDLEWRSRKDEIGELARSFEEMGEGLTKMEQMRQDFVSNVSHEIQTPLTSISGFSKALQNNTMPEQERIRYLEIIQTESERLSRLSENLLKLASLESEQHPFQPSTYALDEQLRHVVVACEPQWSGKRLTLDLSLPNVKIHADKDQLNQVWMNLLGNSIKFTPPGGGIRIQLEPAMSEIRVSISDNGIGITEADRERIFERFFKADRSRSSKTGGSGLGLAIVHKIVALHHGRIEVNSSPGTGTMFTVTLPGYSTFKPEPAKKHS